MADGETSLRSALRVKYPNRIGRSLGPRCPESPKISPTVVCPHARGTSRLIVACCLCRPRLSAYPSVKDPICSVEFRSRRFTFASLIAFICAISRAPDSRSVGPVRTGWRPVQVAVNPRACSRSASHDPMLGRSDWIRELLRPQAIASGGSVRRQKSRQHYKCGFRHPERSEGSHTSSGALRSG